MEAVGEDVWMTQNLEIWRHEVTTDEEMMDRGTIDSQARGLQESILCCRNSPLGIARHQMRYLDVRDADLSIE